jgi:hypothetical protein
MVVLSRGGNDGAIDTTLSHAGLGAEVVPFLATGLGGEETGNGTRRVPSASLGVDIDTIRARESSHMNRASGRRNAGATRNATIRRRLQRIEGIEIVVKRGHAVGIDALGFSPDPFDARGDVGAAVDVRNLVPQLGPVCQFFAVGDGL